MPVRIARCTQYTLINTICVDDFVSQDPYGDDLVDFCVMFFVQFTWTQSNRILMSPSPPSTTTFETEIRLARERISIGGPWDDGTDRGLGKHHDRVPGNDADDGNNDDSEGGGPPESTLDVNADTMIEEQMGFGRHEIKEAKS
jgi:hypothetical protein